MFVCWFVCLCGGLVCRLIIFDLGNAPNLANHKIMKGVVRDLSLRSHKCLPKSTLKENLELLFH